MQQNSIITKDRKTLKMGVFLIVAFVLFVGISYLREHKNISISEDVLQNFSTVLISIILETMPFILLGAFISSLIQVFVSEETITKIIPKNQFMGLLVAASIGLIFPVCECAIIPIARRLIKKGVPVGIAVTFMLAVPIVNPIVLLSTYYAFYNKPIFVLIRGGFGFFAAILIGYLVGWIEDGKNPLKVSTSTITDHNDSCGCGYEHDHDHDHFNHYAKLQSRKLKNLPNHKPIQDFNRIKKKRSSKFSAVIEHTSSEFYDIGKYLTFGAIISAAFQTFVSRGNILAVGYDKNLSVIVMILFAFIISLCSEADAFVARSFMGQFTSGSIAAFLLFGPMLDIKNTLMLNSTFKKRFTFQLIVIIFMVCFLAGVLINKLWII